MLGVRDLILETKLSTFLGSIFTPENLESLGVICAYDDVDDKLWVFTLFEDVRLGVAVITRYAVELFLNGIIRQGLFIYRLFDLH